MTVLLDHLVDESPGVFGEALVQFLATDFARLEAKEELRRRGADVEVQRV